MFAVNVFHDPKSKSTQSLCKASALACTPSNEEELAKLKFVESSESRKSSDATLTDDFKDVHTLKDAEDHERAFSVDSSVPVHEIRLEEFNRSLAKIPDTAFYAISTPGKLKELLDLHHSDSNPMPSPDSMFPYLHGPSALREKVYFDERFDPASELQFLAEDSETISRRFPADTFAKPVDQAFHLMTVNSEADEHPALRNSVVIEDLLTFKNAKVVSFDPEHWDITNFKQFKDLDETLDYPCNPSAQTNRNFMSQITLMAPVSHFIVYNNGMIPSTNLEVANIIGYLRGHDSAKHIYVVDFEARHWPELADYFVPSAQNHKGFQNHKSSSRDHGSSSSDHEICSQKRKSSENNSDSSVNPASARTDGLCPLEQNLVWQVYNMTQLFPHLYVGNALNFKQMVSSSETTARYDFQLYIYCHEKAQMPSPGLLRQTLKDLASGQMKKPIFLEFSDAAFKNSASLPKETVVCFLNILRIVNIVVNKYHKNALVYSYDGFTGTSLLLLSLGLFWGGDHVEEVALCLFRKPEVKFQLSYHEFSILKNLEIHVQWFKRQPAKATSLLQEISLEKIYAQYRPFLKTVDWFRAEGEINFPAFIYDNLYLGSVSHASSTAVLSALHVTKVISIGEKPRWYGALNCTFSHEVTPETTGPVIEPIFRFNKGRSLVYEVKITSPAMRAHLFQHAGVPQLKSFIYIHGVEDDGRDSMFPLLVGCPEWIQSKLLVSPGEKCKTLVHCRIGVSRSATMAIASVMKNFHMSLVESFLYVRVRRFNVVIQPNLRLFYELFLFDEHLRVDRIESEKSSIEAPFCWWTLCAEIHRLNQQYSG